MRTGSKFISLLLVNVLCLGSLGAVSASDRQNNNPSQSNASQTADRQNNGTPNNDHRNNDRPKPVRQKRARKQPPLPPLPSGPQGPVPQVPLDSTPAVAPQVSYKMGQLTIVAPNSTLADILRAVRKQTSAEMEIPSNATERVVTHLGPGPAREVVAELLNGSHFNYVLLGSPSDASVLTRIVLVAKTPEATGANPQPGQPVAGQNVAPQPQEVVNVQPDVSDAEAPEENADENADQNAAETEQPPQQQPDQQGIKTPQQLLQEMQQRQLQMQQQQQNPGQPPVPGTPYPAPQPPPQQQQQ